MEKHFTPEQVAFAREVLQWLAVKGNGGKSRSAKKVAASRANLARANEARRRMGASIKPNAD